MRDNGSLVRMGSPERTTRGVSQPQGQVMGTGQTFPNVDAGAMKNLSKTLESMFANMQGNQMKPEDMIQFGLGVGMALMQTGGVDKNAQTHDANLNASVSFAGDEDDAMSFNSEASGPEDRKHYLTSFRIMIEAPRSLLPCPAANNREFGKPKAPATPAIAPGKRASM